MDIFFCRSPQGKPPLARGEVDLVAGTVAFGMFKPKVAVQKSVPLPEGPQRGCAASG